MANGKAPKPPVSAGRPAKRAVRASLTPTAASLKKPSAVTVEKLERKQDMMTWEKKASGSWTSGQSMGLNPGGEKAISRLRHSKKFVARSKKVIRPRTRKVIRTDGQS